MSSSIELPADAIASLEEARRLESSLLNARDRFNEHLAGIRAEAESSEKQLLKRVESERARLVQIKDQHLADIKREREVSAAELHDLRQRLVADQAAFATLRSGQLLAFGDRLAEAWAEYEIARGDEIANALENKVRPAYSAADTVREKSAELATMARRAKRAEWVVAFYENQFPWLSELRDLEEEQDYVEQDAPTTTSENDDPARKWLTPAEYKQLSSIERNQSALDRYLKSRKSRWQLGRDYERYVGFLREQAGFKVTYQGIVSGFDDLGRDLVCERDGTIEIVQCKRWAQHKTIHEKHVFQLFGTVVAARIEHRGIEVSGTFTTTTTLSHRAKTFARELGIRVEESLALGEYPMIKCNLARGDNSKIYHLPFDQQYDATIIEPERGEFFASTVADAEAQGFRRAWRWRGE